METKRGLLPVGFRFKPTDEEIIIHYLLKKVIDSHFTALAISEADLNKCEPWDLPDKAAKMGEEKEWYFFCQRDRKYSTGMRTNRATESGYWKATGKDREIFCKSSNKNNNNNEGSSSVVGMKKTLVFYKGRAPNGEKTNWVMHEYRLIIDEGKNNYLLSTYYNLFSNTDDKDRWVVCRVIQKKDVGMSRRSQTNSTIKLERIDSFVNHVIDDNDHYDGATLKLPPRPLTDFSNSCHDHHGVEREFIDDDNIHSSSASLSYNNNVESEIFVRQYDHDELKPNALLPPHNTDQIDSTVCVHPHQQSSSMLEYNEQYFPFIMNAHCHRNLGFIPPSNIPMQSNVMPVIGHSQESGVSELINGNATNFEIASVENLDEGLGGVSFSPDISELVDSLWSS